VNVVASRCGVATLVHRSFWGKSLFPGKIDGYLLAKNKEQIALFWKNCVAVVWEKIQRGSLFSGKMVSIQKRMNDESF